jgi:hypothetical protein
MRRRQDCVLSAGAQNDAMIGNLLNVLGAFFALGIFVANLVIALGVRQDAELLQRTPPFRLKIFSANSWAIICLFLSVPALAVYWAAHHSTFAKSEPRAGT